jgi:hypothetical protein
MSQRARMSLRDRSAGLHPLTATPASITDRTRLLSRASPPAWPRGDTTPHGCGRPRRPPASHQGEALSTLCAPPATGPLRARVRARLGARSTPQWGSRRPAPCGRLMWHSRRPGPLVPCAAGDEVLVPGDTAAGATRERRAPTPITSVGPPARAGALSTCGLSTGGAGRRVHDCPSHGPEAAVGRLADVSMAAEA